MKLTAGTGALGWLACQWLLLTFAGDVCQLLRALSQCLRSSLMADTHTHTHTNTHTYKHTQCVGVCMGVCFDNFGGVW